MSVERQGISDKDRLRVVMEAVSGGEESCRKGGSKIMNPRKKLGDAQAWSRGRRSWTLGNRSRGGKKLTGTLRWREKRRDLRRKNLEQGGYERGKRGVSVEKKLRESI